MSKPLTDMRRQTLAAYLDKDLAQRTRGHALAARRSLSSVVAEALALYFARQDLYDAIDRIALQDAAGDAHVEFDHLAVLQQLEAISTEQARQAATTTGQ